METIAKKKINKGIVKEVINTAKDLYYINITTDNFSVKAGQFVSVLCGDLTLRRPFSVMNYQNNTMTIYNKPSISSGSDKWIQPTADEKYLEK